MRKINGLRSKLLITLCLLTAIFLMWFFKLPCPFMNFLGIPCLGCGMTRAFVSALSLDFAAAFSYHKMFWSLPILYLLFLFDLKPFKNRVLNIVIVFIIAVGFVANWIINLL